MTLVYLTAALFLRKVFEQALPAMDIRDYARRSECKFFEKLCLTVAETVPAGAVHIDQLLRSQSDDEERVMTIVGHVQNQSEPSLVLLQAFFDCLTPVDFQPKIVVACAQRSRSLGAEQRQPQCITH